LCDVSAAGRSRVRSRLTLAAEHERHARDRVTAPVRARTSANDPHEIVWQILGTSEVARRPAAVRQCRGPQPASIFVQNLDKAGARGRDFDGNCPLSRLHSSVPADTLGKRRN
jgi:hypothetical protein